MADELEAEYDVTLLRSIASHLQLGCVDWAAGRIESLTAQLAEAREALATADAGMTCRRDDDAHYCPNCDNTTYAAREVVRTAIRNLKGSAG